MAKFKIILSEPETGKSQIVELEGPRAVPIVGRRIGETIDGAAVGLGGHKLKITGGSDKDGFPMKPNIHGGVKTRIIMTRGVGFKPVSEGERRRKTIRGSIITDEIVQINMKIVEKPKKVEKLKEPEKTEPKEEAKPEEPKPEEREKTEKEKKQPKVAKREPKEKKEKPKETETEG